jgi:hypothetical protein
MEPIEELKQPIIDELNRFTVIHSTIVVRCLNKLAKNPDRMSRVSQWREFFHKNYGAQILLNKNIS